MRRNQYPDQASLDQGLELVRLVTPLSNQLAPNGGGKLTARAKARTFVEKTLKYASAPGIRRGILDSNPAADYVEKRRPGISRSR